MSEKSRPLFFILFFIIVLWPLGFLFYKAKSPENKKVSDIVSSAAFLSTLQNKNADACLSMTYMNKVDVVFVGSSLAYSNIEPVTLSEHFKDQSAAVCALSGWNTEFFDLFFKFLKDNNIAPSRVVWLADGSSSIKLRLHEKRLENARNVIFNDELRNKTSQNWIETLGTKPQSKTQLETYQNRIAFHSNRLSALSNKDVTRIILDIDFGSETATAAIAKTAVRIPRNEDKLKKLCANFLQRSIVFDIVIAPGPTTEPTDTFANLYEPSKSIKSQPIASYYKDNVACARSVVSDTLENWGLDNRYYLNRGLRDDYPYEIWKDPASFKTHFDSLSAKEQRWFYDSSHLNGVGATIFTKGLVERLK